MNEMDHTATNAGNDAGDAPPADAPATTNVTMARLRADLLATATKLFGAAEVLKLNDQRLSPLIRDVIKASEAEFSPDFICVPCGSTQKFCVIVLPFNNLEEHTRFNEFLILNPWIKETVFTRLDNFAFIWTRVEEGAHPSSVALPGAWWVASGMVPVVKVINPKFLPDGFPARGNAVTTIKFGDIKWPAKAEECFFINETLATYGPYIRILGPKKKEINHAVFSRLIVRNTGLRFDADAETFCCQMPGEKKFEPVTTPAVIELVTKSMTFLATEFGYRDMHYLIRLNADRAKVIGFTEDESKVIGGRISELQVRSQVQHAWADILHDRMYKAPLKLSAETKRTGALLAAIMEDGDRNFNVLAGQLDGMFANFSAYTGRDIVGNEIAIQTQLLENASEKDRPKVALRLARLTASMGQWQDIINTLKPHQATSGGLLQSALLLELGHALCRLHRSEPKSTDYKEGQTLLQKVVEDCEPPDLNSVPDLRRIRGLHSRALARLGWSWEPVDAEAHQARSCYRKAVEFEPDNPYYLADMIGFEIQFAAGAVRALGFGGGEISAFEYRLALALGATVGVVGWEKDAVSELLKDLLWIKSDNLYPLPADPKTIRVFVIRDGYSLGEKELEDMAKEFHDRYRKGNLKKIKPDNLKLWEDLPDTYKMANKEQAAYAIRILEAAGFGVRKSVGEPVILKDFKDAEIELMAELEHGRWNIERLRDGWRPGKRDDEKKLHDCLVSWIELKYGSDGVKRYDREAVESFPRILSKAGLEVFRKENYEIANFGRHRF